MLDSIGRMFGEKLIHWVFVATAISVLLPARVWTDTPVVTDAMTDMAFDDR